MPRGETSSGTITVYKDDGTAANLTGGALVLVVDGLFSREMDFVDASVGTAEFDVSTGDTFDAAETGYSMEVVFIDNAGTYGAVGGRYQVVAPSTWYLGPTYADDPPVVTAAPSQTALAQGPAGVDAVTLVDAEPTPGPSWRGKQIQVRGGGPEGQDVLKACGLNSDGVTYSWEELLLWP